MPAATLRFSQRRRWGRPYACDSCHAAVHADDLVGHARWHASDRPGPPRPPRPSRPDPSVTENLGDRIVRLSDDVASVEAT